MGEDPLLHAGHEHGRELQALGGVDGHHGDGARLAGERVQVGAQGEPLHQGRQRLAGKLAIGALDLRGGLRGGDGGRRGSERVARDHLGKRRLRGGEGRRQRIERTGAGRSLARGHRYGRTRRRGGRGHVGKPCGAQLLQALQRALDIVVRLLELSGHAQEFLDVLGAALGLHGGLAAVGLHQARLVHDGLDHVLELAVHAAALAHDVDKVGQAAAHLGREHARLGAGELAGLEERAAALVCQHLDLLDRGGADAAARRVDHALDAHLVGRVHDHLEIGHDVADLGTVEESRAAHDLVGHARAQEHIFEDARLGVGAVEHRDVVVAGAGVVQLVDLRADPAALVALVARLVGLDLLAIPLRGEQALLLALRVVAHHGVCRREDMPGGAVVLLELDHLGRRKVLLKVQDVGDVGTAPAVDRLVVVAHDHQVAVLGGEQVGDLVLHVVGVLVLVDADVAEALLVLLQHVGVVAQKLQRTHQQVVEVHGVGGAQALLELQVHAGGLFLLRAAGARQHLLGPDHGVFGRRDLGADHVDGVLLLLDGERLHDVAHHAARIVVVVDGELPGVAQKVRVLAQHAHAHGMEGAHPHAAGAVGQKGAQALAHLGGGLVGKGDGKDLPGAHAQVCDHVRDAEGEHAGLARTGAGKHQQGALAGKHGLALGRVERIDVDGVCHGVLLGRT